MTLPNTVSWPAPNGRRLYGRLIHWDGDYAICQPVEGKGTARVYKANLTYEEVLNG